MIIRGSYAIPQNLSKWEHEKVIIESLGQIYSQKAKYSLLTNV